MTVKLVKALSVKAGYYLEKGGRNAAAWMSDMIGQYGDKIKPHLKDAWTEARTTLTAEDRKATIDRAKARQTDTGETGDMSTLARKLYRQHFDEGLTDPEAILAAVHEDLRQIDPEITRRQTNDAVSRYGQWRQLSREASAVSLRQQSQLLQKISALEDVAANVPPAKTGMEHEAPTDAVRRKAAELHQAMKDAGIVTTDAETQLKTFLDSKKTHLRNQIVDLEEAVATQTKMVKGKGTSLTDAEVTDLEARRTELQSQYDALFPKEKTPLTQEQLEKRALSGAKRGAEYWDKTLANAKAGKFRDGTKRPERLTNLEIEAVKAHAVAARAEVAELEGLAGIPEARTLQAAKTWQARRIADLRAKIAAGDFAPPESRKPSPTDAELFRMKAESQLLKNQVDEQILRNKAANRDPFTKFLGQLAQWRRGFVLSSPVVFAKLTSTAATTMVQRPMEEAVGAGLHFVLPRGFADKLTGERMSSVRLEARAFAGAFGKAMSDAGEMFKTGEMDIGHLYGKHRFDMDPSFMQFFGRLHGAFKTVPKRAEFIRAIEKRTRAAIINGLDVTSPEVQMALGEQAFKDANRSIFLQDNWLSDLWTTAIRLKIDPVTGQSTGGSEIKRFLGRVGLPIVKVPTNIVGMTLNHIFGTITGPARLAYRGGLFNRILPRAMEQSFAKMTPDQADVIMRALKKGIPGAIMVTIGALFPSAIGGYYQRNQKKEKGSPEYGGIQIFGVNIPRIFVHNPLLECLQVGATFRQVLDSKLRKGDEDTQGVGTAAAKAIYGLIEETPFVREMADVKKIGEDPGEWASTYARDLAVPQAVQWTARQLDKPGSQFGPATPRKAEGLKEHIQEVIPGWRNQLPEDLEREIRIMQGQQAAARAKGQKVPREDLRALERDQKRAAKK
jgi:hypothetical protein